MPMKLDPALAEHTFIASVPAALLAVASRETMAAGQVLFRLGDRPQRILFVTAGEVQLIRRDRNGKEIVLQRSRGGFLAEASIDAKEYHCDAIATAAGAVVSFPILAFKRALEGNAVFHRAWSSNLARVVRKLRAQCERLSLHSAAKRVVHYIESEGQGGSVTLSQSRKAWATELGLTHESLYRTLKVLEAQQAIEIRQNVITLR